jgi:arginine deiminase
MTLRVCSEVDRLRRVLIHRPGIEIDRMVPTMMEQLLFDDILHGEEARREHESFCELLRRFGVEVLEVQDLLAEVLAEEAPRAEVFDTLERYHHVPARVVGRLRELASRELADALISGLRAGTVRHGHFFDLLPVPNYFFQRDPQIVLGDRLVISAMATAARDREPLLARTVFRHHDALAGAGGHLQIGGPPHDEPDHGPVYPFPSLEGGDVLVVSAEVVMVGISERTNRRGVEALAEYLRREATSFRSLIAVEMPARRAYMHLDTVFTFIDHGVALGYPAVIEPGGPESARAYLVDLEHEELTFTLEPSLLEALAAVGVELEMVPCGGDDPIVQEREQWTDGANAFAVTPGVIFLYHRNRSTAAALAHRGWRVLSEEEAFADVDLDRGHRTVITFKGRELSRARGGPRCMTMPLERGSA